MRFPWAYWMSLRSAACVVVAALSLLSSDARSQNAQPGCMAGYNIIYVNGIRNSFADNLGVFKLKELVPRKRRDLPITIETVLNPSEGWWGVDDVKEALRRVHAEAGLSDSGSLWALPVLQGRLAPSAPEDLFQAYVDVYGVQSEAQAQVIKLLIGKVLNIGVEAYAKATAAFPSALEESTLLDVVNRVNLRIAENRKVVLVGHSQGNLFVNRAMEVLATERQKLKLMAVHVASPSSMSHGSRITANQDMVINAVRQIYPGTLSGNIDLTGRTTYLSHDFVEVYLQDANTRSAVKGALDEALDALDRAVEDASICPSLLPVVSEDLEFMSQRPPRCEGLPDEPWRDAGPAGAIDRVWSQRIRAFDVRVGACSQERWYCFKTNQVCKKWVADSIAALGY